MLYENLYNCGVQNGNSSYSFTSMESSVANAAHLAAELQPDLQGNPVLRLREAVTVRSALAGIAAVIAFISAALIASKSDALSATKTRRKLTKK